MNGNERTNPDLGKILESAAEKPSVTPPLAERASATLYRIIRAVIFLPFALFFLLGVLFDILDSKPTDGAVLVILTVLGLVSLRLGTIGWSGSLKSDLARLRRQKKRYGWRI